jgi:hypothetical protein
MSGIAGGTSTERPFREARLRGPIVSDHFAKSASNPPDNPLETYGLDGQRLLIAKAASAMASRVAVHEFPADGYLAGRSRRDPILKDRRAQPDAERSNGTTGRWSGTTGITRRDVVTRTRKDVRIADDNRDTLPNFTK